MTGNPDDSELAGLDPYELLAAEGDRLAPFFSTLPEDGWARPTRCEGWSVRDMLAHLAATEQYHRACLDDALD
ncbi:MAG TPA: maleylpyruvate isomerase N-terminal domain-containing protein, partial [Acidimicrobiia bacterium]|nr:maleylpyruvate isomerase N-terminal domain-containing protein [Acidimicrobiia bacterium]